MTFLQGEDWDPWMSDRERGSDGRSNRKPRKRAMQNKCCHPHSHRVHSLLWLVLTIQHIVFGISCAGALSECMTPTPQH